MASPIDHLIHSDMIKRIGYPLLILGLFVAVFSTCEATDSMEGEPTSSEETPVVESNDILINVEDYADASGEFKTHENSDTPDLIGSSEADQWLAFEVDIPTAGRYKTEIIGTSSAEEGGAVWVEDYIGNKDDRTYNITGDIRIGNTEDLNTLASFSRDGSPMNKGKHPIKLHFKNPGTYVQSIKFSLLKEHQLTPEVMTQETGGENLKLVWSDEFDGSGLPDTTKWTYDIGDWGWGNNELQYYTENRLENARQEDGNLIIEAIKDDEGHEWTSARLTTRGKVSFVHGRIEFRAKVPPLRGNWAAGWTLGDEYVDEISWPYCGEIDILESVGFELDDETGNGEAHASIHCGAYYFKLENHPTAILKVENMVDEYHTYAIDWTGDYIKAYVDDRLYFTYEDNSNELTWPYDKPQNLILNLAMGGGWGGAQGMDPNMTSQQFIIDYVRVYAYE